MSHHQDIYPILNKLKVLSKVEAGQKILIEEKQIEIMNARKYWDRLRKLWIGEDRYTTMNKLRGLHLEFKDLIAELLADPETNQIALQRLLSGLNASLRGLSNLMLTYAEDKTIVSQLETIHENFSIEINKLKEALGTDDDKQSETLIHEF